MHLQRMAICASAMVSTPMSGTTIRDLSSLTPSSRSFGHSAIGPGQPIQGTAGSALKKSAASNCENGRALLTTSVTPHPVANTGSITRMPYYN